MRFPALLIAITVFGLTPLARGQFDDPKDTPSPAAATPTTAASSEIRDPAAMFSRDAVRENLARLVTIERTYRVPVTIETVESLRGEPIDDAAIRGAKRLGAQAKGIYILMSKGDHRLEVLVSRDNLALNTKTRRLAIRDAILDEFRKNNYDLGLKRGVEMIEKTLATIRADEPRPPSPVVASAPIVKDIPPQFSTSPSPTSGPGPEKFVRRNQVKLTNAGAKRVVAAAEAKAAEMNMKMNIAVVDDGGHLLAFSRMDDARPASANTALTKAITAATYRSPTGPLTGSGTSASPDVLLNLSLQNAAAASGGKITTLLGGIPIVMGNQVIGAIGVGGGTGEQDAEVAKAAVGQFLAEFETMPTTNPK